MTDRQRGLERALRLRLLRKKPDPRFADIASVHETFRDPGTNKQMLFYGKATQPIVMRKCTTVSVLNRCGDDNNLPFKDVYKFRYEETTMLIPEPPCNVVSRTMLQLGRAIETTKDRVLYAASVCIIMFSTQKMPDLPSLCFMFTRDTTVVCSIGSNNDEAEADADASLPYVPEWWPHEDVDVQKTWYMHVVFLALATKASPPRAPYTRKEYERFFSDILKSQQRGLERFALVMSCLRNITQVFQGHVKPSWLPTASDLVAQLARLRDRVTDGYLGKQQQAKEDCVIYPELQVVHFALTTSH